jgi:diguanylate cyclase (GGDEF)-like protein
VNIRWQKIRGRAQDEFGLTHPPIEQELGDMDGAIHQAATFFAFDPGGIPSYEQVRAQGAREVAQLTVQRAREFQKYKNRVEVDRTRLEAVQAANRKLKKKVAEDNLTSLLTRGEFLKRFNEEVARAKRYGHPISTLFLDIDHFKDINDRFGHLNGDSILRHFGRYLRQRIRRCDIPGRFGGDEFAVVLPETSLDQAVELAERLRENLMWASRNWLKGSEGITVSAGVVHSQTIPEEMDLDGILDAADQALYAAKGDGRNCVRHVEEPATTDV